jgi:hypothetical protein
VTNKITVASCATAPAVESFLGRSQTSKYLASYLSELHVTALVKEDHYVDRHYLDDFAFYYARSFNAPVTHCERLHFFEKLDSSKIEELLDASFQTDTPQTIEKELSENYLGFVVKRPLNGAEIGRTVVRPYPEQAANHVRQFAAVRDYTVHLCGLELRGRGLAFQQQDHGAAVCASTALWSALQHVAVMAGERTPTPSDITVAAASPFPASHGLNYLQMAHAISKLGYIADQFSPETQYASPDDKFAVFRAKLAACLDSRLPVILLLTNQMGRETERRDAHAVTVAGFAQAAPCKVRGSRAHNPLAMNNGTIKTLYVHDDNLGPYAHFELATVDVESESRLVLHRGSPERQNMTWWPQDDWKIDAALVPKPEKLRMPLESLFGSTFELERIFREAYVQFRHGFSGVMTMSCRFALGTEYRRQLFDYALDRRGHRTFQTTLGLPRHVGVVSGWAETGGEYTRVWDAIVDATEAPRSLHANVLGVVAPGVTYNSAERVHIEEMCKNQFKACPAIFGAQT